MRIPCLILVLLLIVGGCASKGGNKFQEFSRAASTGLALGQAAVVDAEYETQGLMKSEGNPLRKAKLQSVSRSHQNALDAMASSDRDVANSRKQFWEMKSAMAEAARKADADHVANKWIGWRVRQIFWMIVIGWAVVGVAGITTGLMGLAGPSAFIMRLLPFSNVFALVRTIAAARMGVTLNQPAPEGKP